MIESSLTAARRPLRTVAHCSLLLLLASCDSCDDPLDPNPPPDGPARTTIVPPANSGYVEARTSMIVSDGSPASWVFDEFTLDEDVTVREVSWQGIYCVAQNNAGAPNPTASAFTISFYSDNGGQPNVGAPLQTSTYPVAETGQVFQKTVSGLICQPATGTTWPFYLYTVELDTPFNVEAGTKYWLSIQANTPSYAVYWGWRDGTPDNNSSLQLYDGDYTTHNVDRAYSLIP